MIGRIVGVAAAVAVLCTASFANADIVIQTMTRTFTPGDGSGTPDTTTLDVCTDTDISLYTIFRLVVKTSEQEKTFNGIPKDGDKNCTQFSEEENLALVSGEDATYKLTVSDAAGDTQDTGSVTFTYPIDEVNSVTIDCGGNKFGRLTLTTDVPAQTNCIPGLGLSATPCYVATDSDEVCLSGLDDGQPDFEVCTTLVASSAAAVGSFTAQYLEYTAAGEAEIVITTQGSTGSTLSELLSRVQGDDTTLSVHSCSNGVCAINPFTQSKNNYDLCGVFTVSNVVSDVGTTTFQDLDLTIDSTDPTVDFHFYNVKKDEPYKVYEDPDLTAFSGKESFSLDCHFISEDSFCNGFLIPDNQQNTPAKIGVAFNDASNAVFTTVDYSRLPGPGSRLRRDPPVGTE